MHVMRIQLKLRVLGRVLSSLFRSKIYQLSSSRPLHTLPSLTLHTPHTLTQCHSYSQRASQEAIVCWKCQRKLDSLSGDEIPRVQFFCPCDKEVVLPPSKQHTYFEIMNCPTTYTVDTESLKNTFKQLQKQLHPDKFSRMSQEEQEYSAQQSALVNSAYSTLLNPYKRGLYLLELNGLTIDEKDNLMDAPEFLEEMWTLRERVDDATASGDTAALAQLQTSNTVNLESISEEAGAAFEAGDYVAAKEKLARMKYFVNIAELLKDTLDLPS